jgi:hypothetical protein
MTDPTPITPSSYLAERLCGIETLLANCTAWQEWVNADDATEALAHIYIPANESPATSAKPFAIVNDNGIVTTKTGETAYTTLSDYYILIVNEPPEDLTTDRDIYLDALNKVGAIMEEMMELQGTENGAARFINLSSVTKIAGPLFRSNIEEAQGQTYQITTLGVEVGI